MDPELQEERRSLQARAVEALRRAETRPQHRSECHAFVLPSFDDCRAYTLLVGRRAGQRVALAVRRIWRRGVDLEKLSSPTTRLGLATHLEPTVDVREVPIDIDFGDTLLRRASALSLPAWSPDARRGLDGERFGLALGGDFLAATYEWWRAPPEAWAGLGVLHHDLVSAVDQLCGEEDGSPPRHGDRPVDGLEADELERRLTASIAPERRLAESVDGLLGHLLSGVPGYCQRSTDGVLFEHEHFTEGHVEASGLVVMIDQSVEPIRVELTLNATKSRLSSGRLYFGDATTSARYGSRGHRALRYAIITDASAPFTWKASFRHDGDGWREDAG